MDDRGAVGGKAIFRTREEAESVMRASSQRGVLTFGDVCVYQCPYAEHWHIGHNFREEDPVRREWERLQDTLSRIPRGVL